MATTIRPISVGRYSDISIIIQLTNGTTVDTLADQFSEVFNRRLLRKYSRLYAQANAIRNPVRRRARLRRLKARLLVEGQRLFTQYNDKSLDSLVEAGLRVKRREVLLFESPENIAKNRLSMKAKRITDSKLKQGSARRALQLNTGVHDRLDPKATYYKHKGSRMIVDRRLLNYVHKEGSKIGRTLDTNQFLRLVDPKVKTVARTTAHSALADAELEAIGESFPRLRYVAQLDGVTTARCRFLDGKTFRADNRSAALPPQHFNCRSWLAPVSRDRDRNLAFQEHTQTPYPTWLKRQPEKLQKLVVGKQNYRSYKAGRYEPRPRWSASNRFKTDKRTGMPVVSSDANLARVNRRTALVGVTL